MAGSGMAEQALTVSARGGAPGKEAANFALPGGDHEVAAFAPGDPANPFNWPRVSLWPPHNSL